MISRRNLLAGAATVAAYAALPVIPVRAAPNVIAGAIRWDAWYSTTNVDALSAQNSLSPQRWQFRAPWFAQVQNPYILRTNGSQANMDTEIQCAANAGLKYWAFDQYSASGQDAAFLNGWNLYQASSINNQINWCWMTFSDQGYWGSTGNFGPQVTAFVNWFLQPNYQKVLANRPLLYMFFTSAPAAFGGSVANFNAMLAALQTACTNAGLGTPYIVVCGGYPTNQNFKNSIGGDAISAYLGLTPRQTTQPTPFSALNTSAEGFWTQLSSGGSAIIPPVVMGWDTRPRKQNPPRFDIGTYRPAYSGLSNYVVPGTTAERASQLQAAVNYVIANPASCPSTAILIYAWTECDEGGGCLIPTLGDPPQAGNTTNILSAVAGVLK